METYIAKGKKEVSMTLSDELWSDCWSTLIFSCGNIDIINHCQRKERSFNATVRLIVAWLLEYSNLYIVSTTWGQLRNDFRMTWALLWQNLASPADTFGQFWLNITGITEWNRVKQGEIGWKRVKQGETGWNRVKQGETGWNRVKQGFISLVAKFQCHCHMNCGVIVGVF